MIDLFEYLSQKLNGEQSIEPVLSLFYSQVDLLRDLTKVEKYRARNNKEIVQKIIGEFLKCRPKYQITRILDELPFIDEHSIVPQLSLKEALRRIYPLADE